MSTHTKESIRTLLMTNDRAVERALVVLFERQTIDEQEELSTVHSNGVGFNTADAVVGTRFARWILGMNDDNKVCYFPKSLKHPRASKIFKEYLDKSTNETVMQRARRLILKYSGQLAQVANAKAHETS